MKSLSALVSSLIVFCCLLPAGCKKRPELIKGSVFVVTKGAGSYKMGLVSVYLLPREGSAQALAEVEKAMSEANAELEKQIKETDSRVGKLQEEKDSITKELSALEEECKGVDAASSALSTAMNLEDAAGIPDDLRFIFEAKAKADAERDQLKAKISDLEGQISSAGEEVGTKKQIISASQEIALRSFYEALQKVGNAVVAKTGADGEFEIKVPLGLGDCVLAASGTRLVGDKEEEYFWFYRPEFDSDGESTARLSNDNSAKRLDELKPVVAER